MGGLLGKPAVPAVSQVTDSRATLDGERAERKSSEQQVGKTKKTSNCVQLVGDDMTVVENIVDTIPSRKSANQQPEGSTEVPSLRDDPIDPPFPAGGQAKLLPIKSPKLEELDNQLMSISNTPKDSFKVSGSEVWAGDGPQNRTDSLLVLVKGEPNKKSEAVRLPPLALHHHHHHHRPLATNPQPGEESSSCDFPVTPMDAAQEMERLLSPSESINNLPCLPSHSGKYTGEEVLSRGDSIDRQPHQWAFTPPLLAPEKSADEAGSKVSGIDKRSLEIVLGEGEEIVNEITEFAQSHRQKMGERRPNSHRKTGAVQAAGPELEMNDIGVEDM